MNKSLVPTENIKPPKELKHFFDDPPLVGNERREDFENLFLTIATAVKPADPIEWILARDVVVYAWEIRRERRIKADIIKLKQREAQTGSSHRLTRADYSALAEAEEESSEFEKMESKPQPKKKEDPAAFLAEAYVLGDRDIDIIDTRIASYEHRRNASLREISYYNEAMARRADKATRDVIDGEFTEAAE